LQILSSVSHLPVHVADPVFCFLFACPFFRPRLLLLICQSMLQILSSVSHLPFHVADPVFCFSFALSMLQILSSASPEMIPLSGGLPNPRLFPFKGI
jgi:hypothetical protein